MLQRMMIENGFFFGVYFYPTSGAG